MALKLCPNIFISVYVVFCDEKYRQSRKELSHFYLTKATLRTVETKDKVKIVKPQSRQISRKPDSKTLGHRRVNCNL